jgi:3-oxoacyl-[acyl-carrier-protein] synthase-3
MSPATTLPVRVLGTGSFLPGRVVGNAELAARFGCTEDWILERTGIRERRYAEAGQATSDLAVEAARRALDAAHTDPSEIGLVICATYSPDYSFPATACLIQDRIGARTAGAFDMEAACSGFMTALVIASQCVASGFVQKVLVVGADTNSTLIDPDDRNTAVLFGDGAGALVLGSALNGAGLLAGVLGSDGSGWNAFIRPAGGARNSLSAEALQQRKQYIHMNGHDLFRFGVRTLAATAESVLAKAGMTIADVDLFIPHQANLRIIQAGAERLGIPPEKTFVNIERCGNTAAASIGIALDEAVRSGRIDQGSVVLLVGFGAGLSWSGGVVRWE